MNSGLYFALLTLIYIVCFIYSHGRKEKEFSTEREKWQMERKDLLDRIQAPSFAEYTNKVVREKKAEQPQEEVKQPEFVS